MLPPGLKSGQHGGLRRNLAQRIGRTLPVGVDAAGGQRPRQDAQSARVERIAVGGRDACLRPEGFTRQLPAQVVAEIIGLIPGADPRPRRRVTVPEIGETISAPRLASSCVRLQEEQANR